MGRTEGDMKNWPTPDVNNIRGGQSLRKDNNLKEGGLHGVSLHHAVEHPDSPHVNWPTPSCGSSEGGQGIGMSGGSGNRKKLHKYLGSKAEAKLNPAWVEQLIGLPPGWTQLSGAEPGENRIDRLRLLGNGVVPATAEKAFRVLVGRFVK